MTRLLIFGCYGYLGGHVSRAAAADPRITELVCYDKDDFDLIDGAGSELAALIGRAAPDAIIGCVGRLDGTPADLIRANVLTTANLLEATATAAPGVRFVRFGSAAEYGPMPFGEAVTEAAPSNPVTPYGVSHLAGTGLLLAASQAGRVDGVTLRIFNPIGPGGDGGSLLGRAATRLAEALDSAADQITMGPLSAYRDFVDVRDVAAAALAAALAPQLGHRVLNVGSGRAVTARQAVEALAAEAGFAGEIREAGGGSARSAAVGWALADLSRARRELAWSPAYDLTDSVKSIWSAIS